MLVVLAAHFTAVLADTVAAALATYYTHTHTHTLYCTTLLRFNVVLLHRRPNSLDMAFKGANQRETRGGGLVRWVALPIQPMDMTTFEMIAGAAPIGYLIAGDVANGKSSM
jgi:hypothetical protein